MTRLMALTVAAVVYLLLASSALADVQDTRAGSWRFNERSGTVAADASGSNNGTYSGGYTLGATGATPDGNAAVDLDGYTGYVDLPYAANPASAFSIEAWVKADVLSGDQGIVSQRDGSGTGRTLLTIKGGINHFTSNLGGTTRDSGVTAQAGRWYHVIFTYAGGSGGAWNFFVDGNLTASGTGTGEFADGGWIVGTNKLHNAGFFNGEIDDVAAYQRALSATEARRLYAHGSRAGFWRLDEPTGTAVAHDTVGSNDGTYAGGYTLGRAGAIDDGDSAVALDGSTGYVDLPYAGSASNAFTVETYVRADAVGGDQGIISQRDGTGTGRTLLKIRAGDNHFVSNLGGTIRDSGVAAQPGRYYHLVLTYAGGSGGAWSFYVDGTLQASGTATGEFADGGWILGANKFHNATLFAGKIDDVAVYSRPLTANEVASLAPVASCITDLAVLDVDGCELKKSDTGAAADPTSLWGKIDCALQSQHQQITTGGDTHPMGDGSAQGNTSLRRMTAYDNTTSYGSGTYDNYGERCELGRNDWTDVNPPTFHVYWPGDHQVTFVSYRLPDSYPLDNPYWQVVMQMKAAAPSDANIGSPAISLHASGGRWRLEQTADHNGGTTTTQEPWSTPAQRNVWTRFAFDVVYSDDPTVGRLKVYADLNGDGDTLDPGEQSPMLTTFTLHTEPAETGDPDPIAAGQPVPSHLRVGMYHAPDGFGNQGGSTGKGPIYCDPSAGGCSIDVDNVQVYAAP